MRAVYGFAIVITNFWWLRSAEWHRLGQTPSLLSDTFVHNELMRRCLVRRQDESLFPGVRYLSKALAPCRIKRTDTVGELRSAEICVPHMPSWKAKKLGKLTQEKYC